MRKITKLAVALSGAAAVAGVAIMTPSLVSAWGDDSGLKNGRPSYTLEQINSHVLGNRVVLNSISNSKNFGDEKYFVGAREYDGKNQSGKQNEWENNSITVKDGQEYIIRLYVHNNNEYAENVAKGVKVAFSIPEESAKSIRVDGIISTDNANANPDKAGQPGKYYSYVDFKSTSDFHLEYVYDSALLENNGVGAKGLPLDNTLVTKASQGGQMIGYYDHGKDANGNTILDGVIPGCYQYSSYVTIRVKAVFDTDFRVSQKVRILGDNTWHNYVDAKVGDKIEIQTQYKNTDFRNNTHENVAMKAKLPKNLKYVSGSTLLFTTQTPNGLKKEDGIAGNGIYIGTYGKDSNAYVRFTAEVVDENLVCGTTGLVNWVQAGVGQVTLQDFATIRVAKDGCTQPDEPTDDPTDDPETPKDPSDYPDQVPGDEHPENPDKFPNDKPSNLPNTGATEVAGTIIAAGSVTTAAGYYIASRRALR